MNKKFIESIELIEKHWVLVTASLGVLTFIIERLFKAGAYIYMKKLILIFGKYLMFV